MGKVDQGVFTHWLLSHHAGRPLSYIGYGGTGKQVRDVLHIDDLCDLILEQLSDPDGWNGATVNVGGGVEGSLSLLETTEICRELTGRTRRDHAGRRAASGRRATLRLRLRAAVRAHRVAPPALSSHRSRGHLRLDPRQRGHRPPDPGHHLSTVIVTGAGGLIGSESVRHFAAAGYTVVGIENDMRARFFGPSASTAHMTQRLRDEFPRRRSAGSSSTSATTTASTVCSPSWRAISS